MSNDKAKRAMTVKGWLRKVETSKISASAFLTAHREWLESGELAEVASPILRMLDEEKSSLLDAKLDTEGPTSKYLGLIKDAVFSHWHQNEIAKAEAKLSQDESSATGGSRKLKNWVATVYNAKGEVQCHTTESGKIEELDKSFDMVADADRWADLRLFQGASDWYAVVSHTKIMRADGDPIYTVIMRQDAMARILKRPKTPFSKKTGTRDNRLSFGVKVKESHAKFSHG
jgi:hypothetical protein